MNVCVNGWMAKLYCKVLWVVIKTRKALYKYWPLTVGLVDHLHRSHWPWKASSSYHSAKKHQSLTTLAFDLTGDLPLSVGAVSTPVPRIISTIMAGAALWNIVGWNRALTPTFGFREPTSSQYVLLLSVVHVSPPRCFDLPADLVDLADV